MLSPERTIQQTLKPDQKETWTLATGREELLVPPIKDTPPKETDALQTCIGVIEQTAREVPKKILQPSNPEMSSMHDMNPTYLTRSFVGFLEVAKEFVDIGPLFEFPPLPPQEKPPPVEDEAPVARVSRVRETEQGPIAHGDAQHNTSPGELRDEAQGKQEAKHRAPYLPRPYHELINGATLTRPHSRYLEFISTKPDVFTSRRAMPPHGPLALTASFNSDSFLGIPSDFINQTPSDALEEQSVEVEKGKGKPRSSKWLIKAMKSIRDRLHSQKNKK